jgi:hypothetical protein
MNFQSSLNKLVNFLEEEPKSYAIIGGFALGLYGVARATMDLDFLINKNRADSLKSFMRTQKCDIFHESENVIQFDDPMGAIGSVDFLYAFRQPSLEMLGHSARHKVFQERFTVNVLIPEDLIGLKLQAMANDSKRTLYDADDIRRLIEANRKSLDWELLRKHFYLFQQEALFKQLKEAYGNKKA